MILSKLLIFLQGTWAKNNSYILFFLHLFLWSEEPELSGCRETTIRGTECPRRSPSWCPPTRWSWWRTRQTLRHHRGQIFFLRQMPERHRPRPHGWRVVDWHNPKGPTNVWRHPGSGAVLPPSLKNLQIQLNQRSNFGKCSELVKFSRTINMLGDFW